MGDSDDDDRRGGRLDKFARERNDYGGGDRRRDDDRRGGGGYNRDQSNGMKRPMPTRGRDDHGGFDAKRARQNSEVDETANGTTAKVPKSDDVPAFLPFKKWLMQQSDDISDDVASAKYNEYKQEHKRLLMDKFFKTHKDEEWFRQKYHPEDAGKRKAEQLENVHKRNAVFKELQQKGFFNDVTLDLPNAKKIIFIMDAVTVKLEGGTDEDLELLKAQKVEDEVLAEIGEKEDEDKKDDANGENGDAKPRKMLLHKTLALFLRNVESNIKQSEVEEVCKRYPGFVRLCLAEPVADKKFARRGWATYRRDVNIKQIALNINSIRIRDTDLHAIINKDLTRKIRTVNGVTAHKSVTTSDLRLAAKLAAIYDLRAGLFSDAPEEERELDIRLGVDLIADSPNPVIKSIKHLIVDEMSPEEEELLRMAGGDPKGEQTETDKFLLDRDDTLLKALDTVIWYLRIVHSVDFYTQGEYSSEDHMPNRCGILHVRGQPPSGSSFENDEEGRPLLTAKFINDFMTSVQKGIDKLTARTYLSEDDIAKLGKKDPEEEVEAYIKSNCVELSAEKWLCPLSGKKFKGPDFIRKHLVSKHHEKLDEAKQDAIFYNAFVCDPNRPVEPEAPPPLKEERGQQSGIPPLLARHEERPRYDDRSGGGYGANRGYGDRGGRYSGGGNAAPRHYEQRRGPQRYYDNAPPPAPADARRDSRAPISYRDLDAPDDTF